MTGPLHRLRWVGAANLLWRCRVRLAVSVAGLVLGAAFVQTGSSLFMDSSGLEIDGSFT